MIKLNKINMETFENKVYDISSPNKKEYSNYLTINEIIQMISPSTTNILQIINYLESNNINVGDTNTDRGNIYSLNSLRTMIHLNLCGDLAQNLLNTQIVLFRNIFERDVTVFRVTRPYSLSSKISKYISYIDDLLRFPSVSEPLLTYGHIDSNISDENLLDINTNKYLTNNQFLMCGNECYGYTTPDTLKSIYKYDDVSVVSESYTGTCIVSFQHRHYDSVNVDTFVDMCSVPDPLNGKTTTTIIILQN